MASIYSYKNFVKITNNVKDGTWNTVDISQFVENEDAVGVIVSCTATSSAGTKYVGCIGIEQNSTAWYTSCIGNGAHTSAVWFRPGSKEVLMLQQSNTEVYIIGEFRAGVKFHL